MIIMFALLIPAVIWFALKLAGCYEPELGLFDLLERLAESLNYPLDIEFNEYSLKTVLVFLLLYAMGIGIYFSSSKKDAQERSMVQRNGEVSLLFHENILINLTSLIISYYHKICGSD